MLKPYLSRIAEFFFFLKIPTNSLCAQLLSVPPVTVSLYVSFLHVINSHDHTFFRWVHKAAPHFVSALDKEKQQVLMEAGTWFSLFSQIRWMKWTNWAQDCVHPSIASYRFMRGLRFLNLIQYCDVYSFCILLYTIIVFLLWKSATLSLWFHTSVCSAGHFLGHMSTFVGKRNS